MKTTSRYLRDGGDFEYGSPVNGTDATNQGIELIARQNRSCPER